MVLSVLALVSLLCACGNATPEKVYLEKDEYCAYRGGEVVTSIAELGRVGDRCKFSWFSSLFDTPIEELSTKRGISVGSTLEDIAAAYEGVHFTGGTIGGETLYDEPIANFVGALDIGEPAEILTWSYFKTRDYMLGEGAAITGEKEVDELIASGDCLSMELIFRIEGGVVSEISLYANEK